MIMMINMETKIDKKTKIKKETKSNKDHQRMMVDPMLMIVLDLRSFLTAVTPTAVVPTAVIL